VTAHYRLAIAREGSAAVGEAGNLERGAGGDRPWQLKMFSRSIKKQQKLALLLEQVGDVRGKRCLLITNGDNNGALNYHFRSHGGKWSWIENEPDHVPEMEALLGETVALSTDSKLPVGDAAFDVVVSIDVHEHLDDFGFFNRELFRVVRPGGTVVVTTPNGDPGKPVTRLKLLLGMTPDKYGHKVIGYDLEQQDRMLRDVGLDPIGRGSYSGIFTELIEFVINYAYVEILSKRAGSEVKEGTIAPTSAGQLRSVEKQYRAYSLIYPILWAVSKLDVLAGFLTGYAVSTVARRPGS
jgi:SAM-dependent methyltransferase